MTPQDAERALDQAVQRAERGDRQALRQLVAALDGPPDRQQAVLPRLASLEGPLFWQDLLAYLAGDGWQILPLAPPTVSARHALQRLFVESFGRPFTPRRAALRAALGAAAPPVRALAATLLGKRGDRTALPPLIGLLADPAPAVQAAAAHALRAMPDPWAVDALLVAMAADDLGVRLAAADALGAVGRPALPALLRRLMRQPTRGAVRDAAAHVLPHLAGGVAPPEVAALEAALHGPAADLAVPVAAARLLRWCEQHPAP